MNENRNCSEMGAPEDVNVLLARIRAELESLMQQRDQIVRKIGTIYRTVTGLVTLYGDSVVDKELLRMLNPERHQRRPGLTRECRLILMNAGQPMTARAVLEELQRRLPTVRNHKDPLASVIVVLGRLVQYGEAIKVLDENGQHRWGWASDESEETEEPPHSSVSLQSAQAPLA